jgi:hypothetical protein
MNNNFNLEHWPIVYFKSGGAPINDESFEEYKKYYLNLLIKCKRNNEKMVLISDLNNSKEFQLNYVIKQAQFNKEIFKFNKEYVICVCILCNNSNFLNLKNILNLYFTMIKPAAPFKLCKSFDKINKYLIKNNINFDSNIFNEGNICNVGDGCDEECEEFEKYTGPNECTGLNEISP